MTGENNSLNVASWPVQPLAGSASHYRSFDDGTPRASTRTRSVTLLSTLVDENPLDEVPYRLGGFHPSTNDIAG